MSHMTTTLGDDDAELAFRMVYLKASNHLERFQRQGCLDDIKHAIDWFSGGLRLIPENHSQFPHLLVGLGVSYRFQFQHVGGLGDLEKAIEYLSRGLALTPESHSHLPYRLISLGVSYSDRFNSLGELDDLEKSIKYFSRALAWTPECHPQFTHLLANLGVSYTDRFRRLGGLDDLEKSIEYKSRALALTPEGHPDLPDMLTNLGAAYGDRFQRLGELDDLENAIVHYSRALTLTPEDHLDLPYRLSNLGAPYGDRFRRLGELSDLDKSIECFSRGLALTPEGHPELPYRLINLGVSYSVRFHRLGEQDDLKKSIECKSRALALTPEGHPRLPYWLNNLGASYRDQFRHLGELGNLEKSIEYHSRSLALTPADHPELPCRLINLGSSCSDRFQHVGELGDLHKAIECVSHGLTLTPEGHPELPYRLSILGMSYMGRFERLGNLGDVESATTYALRALDLTPNGHPDLPNTYLALALSRLLHFRHTGDLHLLQDSLNSFRNASKSTVGSPKVKYMAASEWAKAASKHSSPDCIEAYQSSIDLLPQFIWLGATSHQRYQDLDQAKNLAVSAASAAIRYSECKLALEWLEHARCVVWNQSLMLRSPLDQLHSSHPTLAARLRTVAYQLHQASSESEASRELSSDKISPEQAAQKHRRLAGEYDELLSKARELPGFEEFLRPVKADDLARAARNGPIVVINCDKDRCDALVILPRQSDIQHIPLPGFTMEKIQRARSEIEHSVRSRGLSERGERRPVLEEEDDFGNMLAVLWYDVIKPILGSLGYMNCVSTGSLPHITWCPTGAASSLPFHAAGDYNRSKSRVFDYVISSYTPTLTALLASAPSEFGPNSRVLAIGQEATPGHTSLPGTTKELAYVRAHVQNTAQYTQLINNEATVAAVLDVMGQHDWIHFACHAHQNVADATQSGFFLHDGVLDLSTINRRPFKNKGLAFLSACQTAKGDKELPDEAIHLASGMLMAGYSSVIATMWSVHDDDAPLVADRVYAQLMKDKTLGNGEAGRALHNAVAELRKEVGEENYKRWVPYIHIGS